MSSESRSAKQVFLEAVEQVPPDEWDTYLDQACGDDRELRRRVRVLLEAHAGDGSLLDNPAMVPAATMDAPPITEKPGTLVGPYKLLEQIGEGGMGLVFMARQREPVKRNVALKVIKPGMDSKQVIGRFEAERQALALMDHPNIARVLDAGSTESGRPYFVMDLVRGISVTEYCDRERLSARDRVKLFVPVCQAVQHAHQKGIIHRDIKPSNVLVTLHDGVPVPKVIDFGVAKATSGQLTEETLVTGFAQLIGTPLYMSPEQAELSGLDVDTRTDVYSLGVLLYELLTGTTPFERTQLEEAAYDEMRRIIREEEPPKPSTRISTLGDSAATIAENRHTDSRTLTQQVSGELDWIVMKTLEKDRTRRYETASDLAKDVQRYLQDEPVEACPPSRIYRFRKFARRHKARLATIGAFAALLVVVTVGAAVIAWNRHQEKTELARTVNKELDGVRQSLETGDLAAAGRKLTAARTRLDAARYDVQRLRTAVVHLSEEVSARTRAEQRFHEFQRIRERVFSRIYDLHSQEAKQAAKDCRAALDLFSIFGPRDWKRQPAYRNLSRPLQTKLEDNVVELMFVMARLEVLTVTPDAWTILDDEDRRIVVDEAAHQRAIDVLRRIETVSRPTAGVHAFMSQCWRELGRTDEIQKTDAAGEKLRPTTALDYYILGELLAKRGGSEKALERYGQALGRDPTHYLSLLATGDTLEKLGQLQAAEMALTGAVGANPRPTFPYIKRALIRLRQQKHNLAMADFAEAARRDPTLAEDYYGRGHWNLENGEPDQAISDFSRTIQLDPQRAEAYYNRGIAYDNQAKSLSENVPGRDGVAGVERSEPPGNRGSVGSLRSTTATLESGSRIGSKFDQAAADFGEALTRGLKRAEVYTRRGTARALSIGSSISVGGFQ